jgi:hypothetical protein
MSHLHVEWCLKFEMFEVACRSCETTIAAISLLQGSRRIDVACRGSLIEGSQGRLSKITS